MFAVYILSNSARNALSVDVCDDIDAALARRDAQLSFGFDEDRAKCVWLEFHVTEGAALARYRKLKRRSRAAKIEMVGETNPNWVDVYERMVERARVPRFVSGMRRAA